MTPTQQMRKKKAEKSRKLHLQASEARTKADHVAAAARSAKLEYEKARKAYKVAKKAAKESRKTLKALVRKLNKIAPAKGTGSRTIAGARA